jgi:hypothetical protein
MDVEPPTTPPPRPVPSEPSTGRSVASSCPHWAAREPVVMTRSPGAEALLRQLRPGLLEAVAFVAARWRGRILRRRVLRASSGTPPLARRSTLSPSQ